ncbi:MAG: hypothetical protein KGI33_11070 [Thaumarchaeota archaeon]|nr:hypothetical protein [Nitrososphaerota archaeon]
MALQKDVKETVERNMELMLMQVKTYLPFLRIAFPGVSNLPEFCFNLMLGNALSTFMSQYALRFQTPSESDFAEFGTLASKYGEKVNELF